MNTNTGRGVTMTVTEAAGSDLRVKDEKVDRNPSLQGLHGKESKGILRENNCDSESSLLSGK
jgi:hypothetical protein